MPIVFYISGHGLGHASRACELIQSLLALPAGVRIIVRTSVRAWAFDGLRGPKVEITECEADTGIVQIDSLRLDEYETATRAAAFYRTFPERVQQEAAFLKRAGARLVIGDVPPLAVAAARESQLPSVVVGNFTWDWIYAYYPRFEDLAPGVIGVIAGAYATATCALRLPIAGGFQSMAGVTSDIPFIARRSKRDRAETRCLLGVDESRVLVLSSFGGYGVDLPYERIVATGLMVWPPARPLPSGLQYQDLVAAADVVVSKPGYGIVSECVANRTPLLFTSRGRFAEYDVMLHEMPRILRCRFIDQDDLLTGNWRDGVERLLAQPDPPTVPAVDGAEVAAARIMNLVT